MTQPNETVTFSEELKRYEINLRLKHLEQQKPQLQVSPSGFTKNEGRLMIGGLIILAIGFTLMLVYKLSEYHT